MELFVNNLTVIDFSFLDVTRGLVGESLIVDVSLNGELDGQAMVMDFSKIKKVIKKFLDESVDHALVVPYAHPQVKYHLQGATAEVILRDESGDVECFVAGPSSSILPVKKMRIDKKTLEQWINKEVKKILPDNIDSVSVTLREEHIGGHFYHYAHGLKKHAGNCQRIAHGHRSAIRIFIEGERNPSWEMFWAERWRDCYLMSEGDVSDINKLSSNAQSIYNDRLIASSYTSSQGNFEILMRHGKVEILPHETTIERIAQYIKQEIHYLNPQLKDVSVYAYEGIEKGAFV